MIIRILTALLLSCSVAIAGQGMGPGPGVKAYAAIGDSEVIAYFNCDSDTTGQALQKGTGTVDIDPAIITATGVVGNSLGNNDAAYSWVQIPSANIDYSIGTVGFWVYFNEQASSDFLSAATTRTEMRAYLPYADTVRFSFRGVTRDAGLSIGDGWHFVELSWDVAATSMAIRVNNGSWSETTSASFGTAPSGNLNFLYHSLGGAVNALVDQIIIINVYKKDLYAIRNNTSF